MITCVLDYVIDPAKIADFERFATRWIELVEQHGGTHHGYFLPAEGASDRALALFSFPSLAAYERYRDRFGSDPDFVEADRIRDESGCVVRYHRTFMRPLLPHPPTAEITSQNLAAIFPLCIPVITARFVRWAPEGSTLGSRNLVDSGTVS